MQIDIFSPASGGSCAAFACDSGSVLKALNVTGLRV